MSEREFSLFELNSLVKNALRENFPERYWVKAEMSDVRENYNGHCYLEFVEKDNKSGQVIARARGIIWASAFKLIKPWFEASTGEHFRSGIKVLVNVSIDFHESYGYSLTVQDIDPTYTLGDLAKRRKEIIDQLTDAGVITMNKELELPVLPNRIAIISSSTAAGYGDFMDQLHNNHDGYVFYTHLFPAIMQGEQTEMSIIGTLNTINAHLELFDVVVIIRGGGSTSDLSSFDSYSLAENVAQFPIPIISGIGHDRDQTVLDFVSHTSVKTPTAAAEFLINQVDEFNDKIDSIQNLIFQSVLLKIEKQKNIISQIHLSLPQMIQRIINQRQKVLNQIEHRCTTQVNRIITEENTLLNFYSGRIPVMADKEVWAGRNKLNQLNEKIKSILKLYVLNETNRLKTVENIIILSSPVNILKKGYTITLQNGKPVKSVNEIIRDGKIVTKFYDGNIESKIL